MNSSELTENQIQLIQESFAAVAPKGAAVVASFYERLFRDYPEVKPMFAEVSRHTQQKKLLNSLVWMVQNLQKPDLHRPTVAPNGARHDQYVTAPIHDEALGRTLLKTLAHFAGDIWGSELEEAWATAYRIFNIQMFDAAVPASQN